MSRGARANYVYRLLHFDYTSLPQEVVIDGEVVELEIRARLLQTIELLEPLDRARVDLEQTLFRWTAVAGCAYYEVRLDEVEDRGSGRYFHEVLRRRVQEASFSAGAVPPQERVGWKELAAGYRVVLSVVAYDALGDPLAKMAEKPTLTLSRDWGE